MIKYSDEHGDQFLQAQLPNGNIIKGSSLIFFQEEITLKRRKSLRICARLEMIEVCNGDIESGMLFRAMNIYW